MDATQILASFKRIDSGSTPVPAQPLDKISGVGGALSSGYDSEDQTIEDIVAEIIEKKYKINRVRKLFKSISEGLVVERDEIEDI